MAKAENNQPVVLVHYTSQAGNKNKTLEQEIVKPGSPSARFLRKMESNRLAQPCFKSIDKRNSVKHTCYAYEHKQIIHYLDNASIELFETLLHRNKGIYSEAIYNALTSSEEILTPDQTAEDNDKPILAEEKVQIAETAKQQDFARDNKLKESLAVSEAIKEKLLNIEIVPFGYHLHQHEIRMNFASNVSIFLDEDAKSITAKTIDLSISGTRIKTSQQLDTDEGEMIYLVFDDLCKKTIISQQKLAYRVIDLYHEDKHFIYRLVRVNDQADDEFSHELANFIQTHKRRYKIDLEDFKSTILSHAYERIYAQSIVQLPLYFIRNSGEPILKYALINKTVDLLTHEEAKHHDKMALPSSEYLSMLTQKLPLEKIYLALISSNNPDSLIVPKIIHIYTFQQDSNKNYIAFDTGKKRSKQLDEFIQHGKNYPSFKLWELKLRPALIPKQDQSLNIDSLSLSESELLFEEIRDIFLTGLLSLVYSASYNSKNDKFALLNNKNMTQDPSCPPLNLNKYLFKNLYNHHIEYIKTAEKIHRAENRYQLTTAITLNFGDQVISGNSIDFSPNGLKIALDKALNASIRDEIDISFESLQKKFPKEHLSMQHYRLTYLSEDKTIACFNRDHRFILHEASLFFRKIIKSNSHKLSTCSSDQLMMIRSHLFERILTYNLSSIPAFITHKNQLISVDSIAHDEVPSSFLTFFKMGNRFNLHYIFQGDNWNLISSKILQFKQSSKASLSLIIILQKNADGEISMLSCENDYHFSARDRDFKKLSLTHNFIMKMVLNLSIPFDEKEIADEINEIRLNSKSDALNLLKRIQDIKFIAEISDMSRFFIH